jgi:hypothetical protein
MADELVKAPPAELDRPSWLTPGDTRGTEHITKDDLQLPRIMLAQGLTPQVAESKEGFAVGVMYNNLTEEILGRGPLSFTILRADPPRYWEFFPRDSGGGVKEADIPANDPRTQFTQDADGKSVNPVATKFYDYVILLLPKMEPIALSFKSSGLRTARQLNALMKLRNAPSFFGKYKLTTTTTRNAKGVFAVFQVQNDGHVDEATFRSAEAMHEAIKNKVLVIKRDDIDAEVVDDAQEHAGPADANFDTSRM